jgi:hypothetical protein
MVGLPPTAVHIPESGQVALARNRRPPLKFPISAVVPGNVRYTILMLLSIKVLTRNDHEK